MQSDLELDARARELANERTQAGPSHSIRKVTPRQRDYILGLLDKKQLPERPDMQARVDGLVKALRISEDPEEIGLSFDQAGKILDWLIPLPDKQQVQVDSAKTTGLDDGYYAVRNVEGHKNETSFYRLRSPKNGKWVGWQFMDQVVGHGKRYPVKGAARDRIVALINEQDPIKCRQLFGQEIGACGRCGRELTDDTSRRFGIGPDCRAIMGI